MTTTTNFVFPFSIEVDPMERLLLINFEHDPDSVYVGFEPQVFNDSVNGKGHLVIGWRKDKKVDVYHQRSLHPNPSKFSIAGKGLNQLIPTDMDTASFEITDLGVQANYRFHDRFGRKVNIGIHEQNHAKRIPFGLLAPMGDAATHPENLPLIILHDFYFVRKNQTDILISINEKLHRADELPIRMDRQKMTFIRYCPKPLVVSLNPASNGVIKNITVSQGQSTISHNNKTYTLEWVDNKPAIKQVAIKSNQLELTWSFYPSIVCISTLPPNTLINGRFKISGHQSVGIIAGHYSISNEDGIIRLQLVPSKGWKPYTTKFSTRFLFTVAKVFKKWPTTYQWNALIHKNTYGEWHIKSAWIRTAKILPD